MFRSVIIGQYFPVRSPVHALDPRTKILITLLFVVVLFIADSPAAYAILAASSLLAALSSRVPLRLLLRGLKPILFILVFTMGLHLFMTKGETIFKVGPFVATREGLYQGLYTAVRLVLLLVTTSLLTLTTSPIRLTDGLESLMRPFKRVGVPAHELAMMMTIALRFIPTLMEEAERVMKAQMARGADFESGNVFQRARSLVPLLVPLFVSAFRRADDLAMAMEARCYRGGENRTRMKQLCAGPRDAAAGALSLTIACAVVFLRWGPK
ncbi:MAG: energy-coupling factor transporter transmembrane component T [Bacillota bacterium]|nr:energy-coupling factor transporter transmembrane component T [Bacillota bacterium]